MAKFGFLTRALVETHKRKDCFLDYLFLKMKAIKSIEMSATAYLSTQRHSPEDKNFNLHYVMCRNTTLRGFQLYRRCHERTAFRRDSQAESHSSLLNQTAGYFLDYAKNGDSKLIHLAMAS